MVTGTGVLHPAVASQDPEGHQGRDADLRVRGKQEHASQVGQLHPSSLYMPLRFMRQMTTEKLFDKGMYMVIYLYPEVISSYLDRMDYLMKLLQNICS